MSITTVLGTLLVAASPVQATVTEVIDGDTIDVEIGGDVEGVQLVGIDAPETGTCEAAAAAVRLTELIGDQDVALVPGAVDDRDISGRLLRYVNVPAGISADVPADIDGSDDGWTDVGAALIAEGYAIARFDSRDAFGPHDREGTYITLDEASPPFVCSPEQVTMFNIPTTVAPTPPPTPAPTTPLAQLSNSGCDPNYTGCVPIDSDVDCAGGSGNGPSYTGRVQVIGNDIYDLDSNGDGVGCE